MEQYRITVEYKGELGRRSVSLETVYASFNHAAAIARRMLTNSNLFAAVSVVRDSGTIAKRFER